MLNFEQIKAIEDALGAEKAGPIIQAFESVEGRLRDELVTKSYLDAKVAEIKSDLELRLTEMDGKFEARLAENKAETIKWVAGMLIAQAALIAALVKLI